MRPPNPRLLKHEITLSFAHSKTDRAKGRSSQYADHGTAGILRATVAEPSVGTSTVAEREVADLRCPVVVWDNPTLVDPKGVSRQLRKGDGVYWRGDLWIADGPMEVKATDADGVPVCWQFGMERVA